MRNAQHTGDSMLKGTKVYNRGDMANNPHWGTITDEQAWGDRWVEITVSEEEPGDHQPGDSYKVPRQLVKHEDKGHHGTRIVTEAAYNAYKDSQLVHYARAAGEAAYAKGTDRILPEGFHRFPETAKEWYRGWDEANLAAPIPEYANESLAALADLEA